MRRFAICCTLVFAPLALVGCVAVSAKDINTGAFDREVVTHNGRIYVVDKVEFEAYEVQTVFDRDEYTVEELQGDDD